MLTSRPLLFIGMLLLVAGCNQFIPQRNVLDQSTAGKNPPRLIVAENRCDLIIPVILTGRPWTWGVSTDNSCEYSIQMTVNNQTDEYHLGFSKFCGNRDVRTGTLAELISDGQNDVWHVTSNSGSNIGPMSARFNGPTLELSLTDPEMVKRIFGSRPKDATLVTGGTMLVPHRIPVTIEYGYEEDGR
jgi:hypothetical protein